MRKVSIFVVTLKIEKFILNNFYFRRLLSRSLIAVFRIQLQFPSYHCLICLVCQPTECERHSNSCRGKNYKISSDIFFLPLFFLSFSVDLVFYFRCVIVVNFLFVSLFIRFYAIFLFRSHSTFDWIV